MKKTLTYLLILTLFISCKSDDGIPDCSAVLCEAPTVILNLVATDTDENIISQDNIIKENITIKNTLEKDVGFFINETSGLLYVEKQNLTDTLEIQIDSEIVATIAYDTTKPQTNACCDFGTLKNVDIEGLSYVVENNLITIYLK